MRVVYRASLPELPVLSLKLKEHLQQEKSILNKQDPKL